MGDKSKIEWTEATWNPVVGCTHVSPGCDHCYAASLTSGRLASNPTYAGLATGGKFTGEVRLLPERLDQPLRWTKPRLVFVNSMSDLFHEDVPDEFIAQVFAVMAEAPHHTFQVLTKRPRRMARLLASAGFWQTVDGVACDFPDQGHRLLEVNPWSPRVGMERGLPNVWLGTSVEDQKRADLRIPHLLRTPAAVRFLSCEPLLGEVLLRDFLVNKPCPRGCGCTHPNDPDGSECSCDGPCCTNEWWDDAQQLDWIIVGGESGREARPMHPDWARSLRDQCVAAGVPFFFKQWGEWAPLAEGEGSYGPGRACVSEDGGTFEWNGPGLVAYGNESDGTMMRRVGKRAAGRELDGRMWDEMPYDDQDVDA